MPDDKIRVRIRMYRPGLGDCFLLTFVSGPTERHILIDCGIFVGTANEKQRMQEIAAHIKKTTNQKLDAVVATHEHWDHVAGFHYAKDIFDDDKNIAMNEIWLAWTEDPDQKVVKERRALKAQLEQALAASVQHLTGFGSLAEQECGRAIAEVMAFNGPPSGFDAPAEQECGRAAAEAGPLNESPSGLSGAAAFSRRSNAAMEHLLNLKLKKGASDFLHPGDLLTRNWLPGVRVYVLGPPKNLDFLGELEGSAATEQYLAYRKPASETSRNWQSGVRRLSLKAMGHKATAEEAAELEETERFETFNRVHRWSEEELLRENDEAAALLASYRREDWRRIDSAWYNNAARLALQLDKATNNTSLVLAFELIASGQVLLFVGDAQIGNWQSWHDLTWNPPATPGNEGTITAADLLRRTVFYKVGHHGSINATRKQGGLELMTSPHLVAAIPTDAKFSDVQKGWDMPAPRLEKALLEKTQGRLLRSDSVSLENVAKLSDAGWESFRKRVTEIKNELFVDYWLEE